MTTDLPWLKLYTEIIDDPKLRNFTDGQRWTWVLLMCLARRSPVPGQIDMTTEDMAWRLRRDQAELEACLELYQDNDMVTYDGDGALLLTNWDLRQTVKPSDQKDRIRERVNRHRERAKSGEVATRNASVTRYTKEANSRTKTGKTGAKADDKKTRNAPVTPRNAFVTPIEERRIDKDKDKDIPLPMGPSPDKTGDNSVAVPPPTPKAKSRRSNPSTPAPESFEVTETMLTWARSKGYWGGRDELERETEKFLGHHTAKGSTFKQWAAAWRTWILNTIDFGPPKQYGSGGGNGVGPRPMGGGRNQAPPRMPIKTQDVVVTRRT